MFRYRDLLTLFDNMQHNTDLVFLAGTYIYNTVPLFQGSYNYLTGTSMATPCIAAISALLMSAKPGVTADDIRNLLQNTATDIGTPGKVHFSSLWLAEISLIPRLISRTMNMVTDESIHLKPLKVGIQWIVNSVNSDWFVVLLNQPPVISVGTSYDLTVNQTLSLNVSCSCKYSSLQAHIIQVWLTDKC